MRKSKLSYKEIEEAESADDKRRRDRQNGFTMMEERDRGYTKLSNGEVFLWHVPPDKRDPGLAYASIPEGHFALERDGQRQIYDLDEFTRCIRWA